MQEMGLDEFKKVQIDILQVVHDFCNKSNIRYYLTYGTLLGAIRHKGYIPWDDDIDICMPRPEYNRFLKEFNSDRYEVVSFAKDKQFLFSFSKVIDKNTVLVEESSIKYILGINIDVFPIDGIDDDNGLLKRQIFLRKLANFKIVKISKNRHLVKNFGLLLGKIVLCFIPTSFLIKTMISNATKHSFISAKKVCCVAFGSKYNLPVGKKIFEQGVLWQFEDKKFYVPVGYDEYLHSVFGDYMKLPPVEQRRGHHKFKAYYKQVTD